MNNTNSRLFALGFSRAATGATEWAGIYQGRMYRGQIAKSGEPIMPEFFPDVPFESDEPWYVINPAERAPE